MTGENWVQTKLGDLRTGTGHIILFQADHIVRGRVAGHITVQVEETAFLSAFRAVIEADALGNGPALRAALLAADKRRVPKPDGLPGETIEVELGYRAILEQWIAEGRF